MGNQVAHPTFCFSALLEKKVRFIAPYGAEIYYFVYYESIVGGRQEETALGR